MLSSSVHGTSMQMARIGFLFGINCLGQLVRRVSAREELNAVSKPDQRSDLKFRYWYATFRVPLVVSLPIGRLEVRFEKQLMPGTGIDPQHQSWH